MSETRTAELYDKANFYNHRIESSASISVETKSEVTPWKTKSFKVESRCELRCSVSFQSGHYSSVVISPSVFHCRFDNLEIQNKMEN